MKTLQTEVAELGYLESGPTHDFSVLMRHEFPDDALAWEGVVAHLGQQLFRLLRPYLAPPTAAGGSFLTPATPCNANNLRRSRARNSFAPGWRGILPGN